MRREKEARNVGMGADKAGKEETGGGNETPPTCEPSENSDKQENQQLGLGIPKWHVT